MSAKHDVARLIYAGSRSHISGRRLRDLRVEIGGTPKAKLIQVKQRGGNQVTLVAFQIQKQDDGRVCILSTLSTTERDPKECKMLVDPRRVTEHRPEILSMMREVFATANLH